MVRIGLFGRKNDPQLGALASAVRKSGGTPVVVDFHNFPRFNLLEMGNRLRFDDIHLPGTLDLEALDAACLRTTCFQWPETPTLTAGTQHDDSARDLSAEVADIRRRTRAEVVRIAVQTNLLRTLAERIPLVNHPDAVRHHRQKARQHQLLVACGIPTPPAIVTNDPDRIRRFLDEHHGEVVVKPQASGAEVVMADEDFLEAHRHILARRPFLFQRYVRGRSLRCYVVGGHIISLAEILHDGTHVDWRERTTGLAPERPTPHLEALVRKAVHRLNLAFCAIDLEEDARTGQTWFLDFNPSALFTFWSRKSGVDVAAHLARYLVDLAAGRRERGFPFPERRP